MALFLILSYNQGPFRHFNFYITSTSVHPPSFAFDLHSFFSLSLLCFLLRLIFSQKPSFSDTVPCSPIWVVFSSSKPRFLVSLLIEFIVECRDSFLLCYFLLLSLVSSLIFK